MKARLNKSGYGNYLLTPVASNRDISDWGYENRKEFIESLGILIQIDFEVPPTAINFGWNPCHNCQNTCHGSTDGTTDCQNKTVGQMISEARDFLDNHIGEKFDDPGYFTE